MCWWILCKLIIIWLNYERKKNGAFFYETPCICRINSTNTSTNDIEIKSRKSKKIKKKFTREMVNWKFKLPYYRYNLCKRFVVLLSDFFTKYVAAEHIFIYVCVCVHLCVEDRQLCTELSVFKEKDAGHKVCKFFCLYHITCCSHYYNFSTGSIVVLVALI